MIRAAPEFDFETARLHALNAPPAGPGWNHHELSDLLPPELAPAAVLVALVPRSDGARVLLTRRTEHLRQHAGQIAFPGGRVDPLDRDAVATALRETQEEVGIDAGLIEPLGFLDPFDTITGFRVLPVVARLDPHYVARPAPDEVAETFEVPLSFLFASSNCEKVSGEFGGRVRHYWQFRFGPHRIWGATAAMLLNLRRRIATDGADDVLT